MSCCTLSCLSFKVIPIAGDVRKVGEIKTVVDEMVEKVGLPHIVINNAAGNFISPTERLSSNAFSTILEIVLHGTANVTLDIGKRLIAAKQGIYYKLCFVWHFCTLYSYKIYVLCLLQVLLFLV